MRNLCIVGLCGLVMGGCGRDAPDSSSANDVMGPTEPATVVAAGAASAAVATAQMNPTQGNTAAGTLQLAATDSGVRVTGRLSGLEPNSTHGLHIHEKGDCSAPDATSAGEHFAPLQHPHGAPGADTHVGDLGNVQADAQGNAEVDANAVLAQLGGGVPTDVKGKAVIVHAQRDDLTSQPSGDAGDRIACGVIS